LAERAVGRRVDFLAEDFLALFLAPRFAADFFIDDFLAPPRFADFFPPRTEDRFALLLPRDVFFLAAMRERS
jgi:hypothetical protein